MYPVVYETPVEPKHPVKMQTLERAIQALSVMIPSFVSRRLNSDNPLFNMFYHVFLSTA